MSRTTATPWRTITGPMAWCAAPGCDFVYHGDRDPSAHRAMNAARLHADETGHEPIVERGQQLSVRREP